MFSTNNVVLPISDLAGERPSLLHDWATDESGRSGKPSRNRPVRYELSHADAAPDHSFLPVLPAVFCQMFGLR